MMQRSMCVCLFLVGFSCNLSLCDDDDILQIAKEKFDQRFPTSTVKVAGGIAGGLYDDANQDLFVRARSFDMEHTFVRLLNAYLADDEKYFGALFAQLPDNERQLLQQACATRIAAHSANYAPLERLLAYKLVEVVRNLPVPAEARERILLDRNLPEEPSPPTKEEANAALLEYSRAEMEAEQQFADAVNEILPPKQQELFLRPFAQYGSIFLAHPFGVEYLGVEEDQLTGLRRAVRSETSTSANAVRDVVKEHPGFATAKRNDQLKAFSPDRLERIWEAQFKTLLLLDEEQLMRYLRLKYDLVPSATLDDWIESIPQDSRRKIAREVLAQKFLTPESDR